MVGFCSQKPTLASQVVSLHLKKPSNPNPTGAIKKSGQILQKQVRSGKIQAIFSEKDAGSDNF